MFHAGDSEEHAHLLAGFFMELGQQSFVVLGASTLGARSAFVMTTGARAYDPNNPTAGAPSDNLDEGKLRLWNPISGVCTHIKDPTCDMRQASRNAPLHWASRNDGAATPAVGCHAPCPHTLLSRPGQSDAEAWPCWSWRPGAGCRWSAWSSSPEGRTCAALTSSCQPVAGAIELHALSCQPVAGAIEWHALSCQPVAGALDCQPVAGALEWHALSCQPAGAQLNGMPPAASQLKADRFKR
eukprot:364187-Chlamydomonas_euryale.AAC.14